MRNLFINHIKKMTKQKSKFLGLLMLVILSVSIYSSMINLFSPLKPVLNSFDTKYHAEDFRMSFDQKYLQEKITEKNQLSVEDMSEQKQKKLVEEAVRSFETDNQLLLEENKSKQLIQINGELKQNYIFVTNMNKINESKIIEGRLPAKKGEIAMNPQALETLNLKVGDMHTIDEKEQKIVGTLMRPDYIALSNLSIPSSIAPENNFLVLSSQPDYEKVKANETFFYSGKFKGNELKLKKNLDKLTKNGDIQLEYASENPQMSALTDRIKSNEISGVYFAALILIIASFMIGFIIKRELQEQKKTIGVFKAQGYKSSELVLPYLSYALFLSVVGSVVGYLLGYFISKEIRKSFLIYFNIPKAGEQFPVVNLLAVTGIVTILLTILIVMVTFSIIRKPPIDLLKDTQNTKKKKFVLSRKKKKASVHF